MKIRLSLLVATSLFGAVQLPAFADCASDIRQVEPRITDVHDHGRKDKAQGQISRAMELAENGDEKGCYRLLGQAKKTGGI